MWDENTKRTGGALYEQRRKRVALQVHGYVVVNEGHPAERFVARSEFADGPVPYETLEEAKAARETIAAESGHEDFVIYGLFKADEWEN